MYETSFERLIVIIQYVSPLIKGPQISKFPGITVQNKKTQ